MTPWSSLHLPQIVLALWAIFLISGPGLPTTAGAQAQPSAVTYSPPNRGAPGSSSTVRDAGSRGCGLMTLSPAQTHWGETLSERPTFWLQTTQPGMVTVFLQAEDGTTPIYQGTFEVLERDKLFRFDLPNTVVLEPDQLYRWSFALDCPGDPDLAATGIVVRRRPTPELVQQLSMASSYEQTALLAARGFWYDALTTLIEQRQAHPQDPTLETAWRNLLQHPMVALDDWVNVPLPSPAAEAASPDSP